MTEETNTAKLEMIIMMMAKKKGAWPGVGRDIYDSVKAG